MAYDTQDQQEMDNFKRFWNSWGKWLFVLLVLAGIGYVGWTVYQGKVIQHQENAAQVLYELDKKIAVRDLTAAKATQEVLQKDFADTVAASQGALIIAGSVFEHKNYAEAQSYLEWVQKNSKNPIMLALATKSLANVYLQQQKYDQALAVLKFKLDPVYDGFILETKGDVLVAQNKPKEAREAYEMALAKTPAGPEHDLIELKRNQQGL